MTTTVKEQVKNGKSQTEVVKELMKRYPKITAKEIEEQTGYKRATIYAIQSRMRNKAKGKRQTANKAVQGKVGHTKHMNNVSTVDTTEPTIEDNAKVVLFNRITDTYLSKIAEAKDFKEAEKYNKLLMEMLQSI